MLSSNTAAAKQRHKRRANPRKSKPSPIAKQPAEAPSSPAQHAGRGPPSSTSSDALNALLANPMLAKVATAIRNGNGAGFSALVRNKKNGIAQRLVELPRDTLADLAVDIVRHNCPPTVLMWLLVETRVDPTRTLGYFTSQQDDQPQLTANQRQMLALVLTHHVSTSRVSKDGDDDDDGGEATRANSVLLEAFCKALASKNQIVVKAYHDHVPTPTICSLTYRSTQINSMIHSPPAMALKDINGKLLELVLMHILPLINTRPRSDEFYSPLLGPFHAPRARKGAADASSSQAHLGNVHDGRILARIVSYLDVYSANELRKSCRGLYTSVATAMEDRFPRQLAFMYSNFVTRQEFAFAADESANQFENKVEQFVRLATHPRVLTCSALRGWMIHCALVRCAWDVADRLLSTPGASAMDTPTLYLLLDGFLSTIEGGSKLFNHIPSNSQHTTYAIRSGRRTPSLAGVLPPMNPPLTASELADLESLVSHDEPIHVPASALAVLAHLAGQLGTRCWLLFDTAYFVPLLAALKHLPALAPAAATAATLDAQAVLDVLVPMANGDLPAALAALSDSRSALAKSADDEEGTVRNLVHAAIRLGHVDVARALIDEYGLWPTAADGDNADAGGEGEGGQVCMRKYMWFAGRDPEYMCRLAAASGECAMHDFVAEWIHGAEVAEEETSKWLVLDQRAPHRRCLVTAKRAGHEHVVRHILTKCGYDMEHEYTLAFMGPVPEQVLSVAQALKRGLMASEDAVDGSSEIDRRCDELLKEMLAGGILPEHLLTKKLVDYIGD